MEISNFKPIAKGFATIEVEDGFWIFKKKETKVVYKLGDTSYWRYLSDGCYTADDFVENLENAYHAKQQLKELENV